MKKIVNPARENWKALCERNLESIEALEKSVRPILRAVKRSGDKALQRYVHKFDGVKLKDFAVSEEEFAKASGFVDAELKQAIQTAKYNIAQFHISQKSQLRKVQVIEGVECWRQSAPIQKVGLYIPSRQAPLFSTILMLGIPANIAGCEEIVLCTTPNKEGEIHPILLYTASLLNIKNIYKIGGVQAIAAMAYGTETIPKVYKIFGPSNQYVTAAKQLVSKSDVAIDLPAGPSELMILADEQANPEFVAVDLLANAENGASSHMTLVTTSNDVANKIENALKKHLENSTYRDIAERAIENNGRVLIFNDNITALDYINQYGPENLVLNIQNAEVVAERKVKSAGAVFLGNYSVETVGNYAAGPNSTLPTNGFARAYSGVSVDSFVKQINIHNVTPKGLKQIGKEVEKMAEAEGLFARKNAIQLRLDEIANS